MKVEKYNRNGWLVGQDSAPATAVISSSGDNEVAAAVTGQVHIIEAWQWQATADGDQTALLKIGDTVFDGIVTATKSQGKIVPMVEYRGAVGDAMNAL